MDALTVIRENLGTRALKNNMAFGEILLPLPFSSAAAVLSD